MLSLIQQGCQFWTSGSISRCAAKPIIVGRTSASTPCSNMLRSAIISSVILDRGPGRSPSVEDCCGEQTLPKNHDDRPPAQTLRPATPTSSSVPEIALLHHHRGHDPPRRSTHRGKGHMDQFSRKISRFPESVPRGNQQLYCLPTGHGVAWRLRRMPGTPHAKAVSRHPEA